MKNLLAILCLLIGIPFLTSAQDLAPQIEEDLTPIKFVIGLEAGSNIHNVKGPGLKDIGLSLEIPYKKFTFGTGVLFKNMGNMNYITYTGYSYHQLKGGEVTFTNEYERHKVELTYISIPLRLQMRLPNNRMYIQGGVEIDFLKKDSDQVFDIVQFEVSPEDYAEEDILKEVNYSFVLGLGFFLHQSRRLRIFMRPEYEFMLNNIKSNSTYHDDAVLSRLKMNLGVQYGI